jgi:4-diphosphocytidyl-2-C-methyl-D-erythritol kinase
MTNPRISLDSYAKINLSLEILRKRGDGFHEIKSIIQTVSLADRILLSRQDGVNITVQNACIPLKENLAFKAVLALQEFTGCTKGANIHIQKTIPLDSGLGGGSSNAATVLMGLNELWELNLPKSQLKRVATELGSDVPFFINGGTAFIEGKGEKIRAIPDCEENWYFLIVPPSNIKNKTREMYSLLKKDNFTKGFLTQKLEARLRLGGDLPSELMFNGFYSVARNVFQGFQHVEDTLESLGAKEAHLTGSGPAMFCRISDKSVGKAMQMLAKHEYDTEGYVVSSIEANVATSIEHPGK